MALADVRDPHGPGLPEPGAPSSPASFTHPYASLTAPNPPLNPGG